MAKKKDSNTGIMIILIVGAIFILPKLGLFSVGEVCMSNEPTTREELVSWNGELRSIIGYPPEPFLLIPEKEYQGTNGYFPFTKGEAEPLLNILCTDFFDYLILEEEGHGEVSEIMYGRKIYYAPSMGYIICIGNDKLGLSLGDNETRKDIILDKYFNTFYTCQPTCNNLYWYDNQIQECGYKQFCGAFMYQGLKTFSTLEQCQTSLKAEPNCLFTISDFCVKLWMILVAIGGIFFIIISKSKNK